MSEFELKKQLQNDCFLHFHGTAQAFTACHDSRTNIISPSQRISVSTIQRLQGYKRSCDAYVPATNTKMVRAASEVMGQEEGLRAEQHPFPSFGLEVTSKEETGRCC